MLHRADLVGILDFLADVGEFEFDRPYPPAVVARLAGLVPCDRLGYQEQDTRAHRTAALIGVNGAVEGGGDGEALYWNLGPCPITEYRLRTGELAAVRLSDVTDRRRYLESPIYRDYFAPHGIEHMVDLGLPAAPWIHRSFILFRRKDDGDFAERDRAVLDALRPHLARFDREAALRRQLKASLQARAGDAETGPYNHLTSREREIVELVAQGKTNAQIAAALWVAPSTVKKHLENVYQKLGVGRRTAAATFGRAAGWPD